MRGSIFAAALVVGALAGCTPTLHVVSYSPGIVAPRGRTQMNVVLGEGKAGAREVVARQAVDALRGSWFRPVDRTDENVKFTMVGHHADFVPRSVGGPDALWMRIDVVNWNAEPVTIKEKNSDGAEVDSPGLHVVVGLQITVIDEDGHILVDERPYDDDEVVPRDLRQPPDGALAEAAKSAVNGFVDDVTPDRVVASVRLDDTDSDQKIIVGGAQEGKLPVVTRMLRKYIKKNPNNAIAHYNMGALLEAQSRFDDALREYDRALDIQPRDYYPATRLACQQRRAAWLALYGDERDHKGAATASASAGDAPPAPAAP